MRTSKPSPNFVRVLHVHTWIAGIVLFVATLIAYAPVWQAGFIWDDDSHLTKNPCVIGPLGFKEIWTSSQAVYYPLVLTSFRILHSIFGLNPLPYHLANVLLHGASTLLLWLLLRKLRIPGAWLGAAIWALHPVMVQSVAWVTELKNTQSCFFFLLSILCFLKMERPGTNRSTRLWLGLSLLLFVLAVTSKSSTVMLPAVLALCIWWQRGRLRASDFVRLAPFFAVAGTASVWTIWEQKFHSGALGPEWIQSWAQRLIIAGYDFWFYLGKLIWPYRLTFIYPRWAIDSSRAIAYLPVVGVAAVFAVLWWRRNDRRVRPLFLAGGYFGVLLFPVLGFFSVYFFIYSFVSDHFQYLASIGPIALAGAGLTVALDSIPKRMALLQPALCGLLLLTLGTLTWQQSQQYRDIETLWRTTIARNPASWMAEGNLANFLLEKGDTDEAIAHYEEAVEIWPGHAEAHNNLANAFLQKGMLQDAAVHFRRVLEIWPNELEAHNNLGGVLLQEGRVEEAIAEFEKVLALNPGHARARNNLGNAFLRQGRIEEAITHFEKTLTLPFDHGEAQYNLGNACLQKGAIEEAIVHYRAALELRPDHANTHNNLANALERQGALYDALNEYEAAAKLEPDSILFQNNLAWMLATCPDTSLRDGPRAVAVGERATRLANGSNAVVLRTVAAAYFANGRWVDAVTSALRALELANAQGNIPLSETLQRELALYRNGATEPLSTP